MLKASNREKQKCLDVESIKNFPCSDLRTIDQLWVKYSNGRFGFSVQKKICLSVGNNELYLRFSKNLFEQDRVSTTLNPRRSSRGLSAVETHDP